MIIAGSQESQSRPRDTNSSRDLDKLIADLREPQRARAPTVDPAHRPEKPRNPVSHRTNVIPVAATPNPDDPIQTAFQRTMLDEFEAEGRWGLVCAVYAEARRRYMATYAKTWTYLIEDYERGNHYMFQLACMLPDEVIVSLIRNTLPSDYASNSSKALRSFVDHEMNPSSAYTGIYLNITTRAGRFGYGPGQMQQGTPKTMGKWLSSNEVAQMLDKVKKYKDNKPADERDNTLIDNQLLMNPPPTIPTSKRRFKWEKGERIERWMAEMRRQYCTNIAPADADKFFLRCPSEVGFANDIPKRLEEHRNNAKTTPIFGLVNAITRVPAHRNGPGFPDPWGVVLWPLWKEDLALSQVAEAFGHVLCSSYWYDGGFNFHEAGYSTFSSSTATWEKAIWANSIKQAGKRIGKMLLDDESTRAVASDAQVDCLLQINKSLASHVEVQKEADESTKKLEDARKPLQEKESDMNMWRRQVDRERDNIRQQTAHIKHQYVVKLFEEEDKLKKAIEKQESEVRGNRV